MARKKESMTLEKLGQMTAKVVSTMATKDNLKSMATKDDLDELRVEIKQDVDSTLDRHLGTYMQRYDELARRIKRLEERVGRRR